MDWFLCNRGLRHERVNDFEFSSYLLCFDSEVLFLRAVKKFFIHMVTLDYVKVY